MKNTKYHELRKKNRETNYLADGHPSRFVFVLTNKCNLSCDFCFQHRKSLEGQLSAEEWIAFSNMLPKGSHVTLTGGEPLIFRDFPRVFREVNIRHTTNIISNGTKFNPENIKMMAEEPNFMALSISIDTIGNHNRNVSIPVYQEMIDHLSLLRSLRGQKNRIAQPVIDAKCVVTDDNAPYLVEIFEHVFETLNVDTLVFQFLKGSPLQHADKCFPFESIFFKPNPHIYRNAELIFDKFNLIRQLLRSDRFRNKSVYTHPSIYLFGDSAQNLRDHFINYLTTEQFSSVVHERCYAPWESVHINANGDIFPCLAIKIGNAREFVDIKNVYDNNVASSFRALIKQEGSVPACSRCGYLNPKGLCAQKGALIYP